GNGEVDVNCTFLFTGGHYAVVDIGSKSGGLPPSAQTGGPAGGFTITDIHGAGHLRPRLQKRKWQRPRPKRHPHRSPDRCCAHAIAWPASRTSSGRLDLKPPASRLTPGYRSRPVEAPTGLIRRISIHSDSGRGAGVIVILCTKVRPQG